MFEQFTSLGISEPLAQALAAQQITQPTSIQQEAIPVILSGKDVIARSETGSGKTLAYLLPVFEKIDPAVRGTQALILTPTHELAVQVHRQAELLQKNGARDVSSALIIGAANITRQIERLKGKPQIVIGSAGRILDLIHRKKIQAHLVRTIVLDEGDRLLDDLNREVVEAVIHTTLRDRQLLLFSASVGAETQKHAQALMKEDAQKLFIQTAAMPAQLEHCYILTQQREKILELRKILAGEKPKKAIVFLNNPTNIEVTVDKLNYHGIEAAGIYGMAHKTDRKQALEQFRKGMVQVLVASDIGARGLDIPEVTHVINLDIPEDPTFYLHRAGRCGRQGKTGMVLSLATPSERRWIHRLERALEITIHQKEMSHGKLVDSTRTKSDLSAAKKKDRKDSADSSQNLLEKQTAKREKKRDVVKQKPAKQEEKGFFARKAERLAQKEENRRKSQKK